MCQNMLRLYRAHEYGNMHDIMVGCGKCPDCVRKRTNDWVFRLRQEELHSSSSFFITLTYDTDHVPITKNGLMSLDINHYKLLMKYLRRREYQNKTLRFYIVGEYGGKFKRPHYHMILFNFRFYKDDKYPLSIKNDMVASIIRKYWKYGSVHVGDVTSSSIAYTLKYMSKDRKVPLFSRDDRVPEFARMSNNLGLCYLSPNVKEYLRINNCCVRIGYDGQKIIVPRYYREIIFGEDYKARYRFRNWIKRQVSENETEERDFLKKKSGKDVDRMLAEIRVDKWKRWIYSLK